MSNALDPYSTFHARHILLPGDRQVYKVEAVPSGVDHIVPPAGKAFAFDVTRYKRCVEVLVSRTGASVRVFVDGVEVK